MRDADPARLTFFLGGRDLEMVAIAELLAGTPARVVDHGLRWGATAAAYRAEIDAALDDGQTVVLVELPDDLGVAGRCPGRVVEVDHHGDKAGADRPTSLEQVYELIGRPPDRWTRWHDLVTANDKGHVAGMMAVGATAEELRQVRAADRRAQGIAPAEEEAGRQAAAAAETRAGGRLTVVRLPHDRTATVTDVLDADLGGPGFDNLLVLTPAAVTLFGEGRSIQSLRTAFPGGWHGGALPARGYWGHPGPLDPAAVVRTLEELLRESGAEHTDDTD